MIPPRLVDEGSAFDRRLVSAARHEMPTEGAEARALSALGLTAGAPPPVTPLPAAVLPGLMAKLLAALLAALVGGAAGVAFPRPSPPSEAHPAPASVVSVAAAGDSPASLTTLPSAGTGPLPSPAAAASAVSSPRRQPPRRKTKPSPPEVATAPTHPLPSALTAESLLLQRATQALSISDSADALSALATYARRYPHGALAGEAGYLRVQALLASGDRAAAMDLARHLLASDPHGVLSAKLQAIVASEPVP